MKRAVAILCFVLCLSLFFSNNLYASALTTNDVKTQIDNFRTNSYKPGSAPPSSSYRSGTSDCFGFVDLLCRKIFGHNLASQKSAMELNSSSNFSKIGSTLSKSAGTLSENSLKNLLSSAVCGDIVQMDYTTYDGDDSRHTMMVYSVSSTGVVFYHAGKSKVYFGQSSGTQPLWGTTGSPLTWENLLHCLRGSDDGISLYRSVQVNGSSSSATDTMNPDNYTYPTRSLTYTSPTMKGDDVKWVQAVLCKLGYTVDIDGSYGQGTVSAIKSFQSANSLSVDGKCGPATRAKLLECWNAKKAADAHTHSYSPATCTSPQRCSCGATTGSALGHAYSNACDASCNRCTATRSTSHSYSDLCDTSCNVCGATRETASHIFENNADTTCDICGAYAYPGGDTLVKKNGIWYHIVDRQKVKDTTLCYYGGYWFYVKNGQVDWNANTLCKWNGIWFHVKGGQVVYDTTLVNYGGYWFYVKNGRVDFNATTLCYFGSNWYYVKGGQVNYSNTLCKWNGKWYHVKNGVVVYDTTLVNYGGYWFYVKEGRVDFSATTLCYYGGYWFYVKGGQVDWTSNTLCYWNGKWYHVSGGKVVYDTTLVYWNGKWWYVKSGVVNQSNTLCYWNGKWYHVNGGTVVYDTTLVYWNGKWWYVKSGVVNQSNTLCKWNGKWYHVNGGTVVYDTTLVYFGSNWYCVRSGVVDFSYSGKVLFAGTYYTVKNGVKV